MDLLQLMYLILGGFMLLALITTILVIAGKDMLYAFFRRFAYKHSDVFVIDSNRQISHYYKKAKDGIFKINGKIYITNPEKMLNLSDNMIQDAMQKLNLRRKRLEKRITRLEEKAEIIKKKIKGLSDIPENVNIIDSLNMQRMEILNRVETLKGKLKIRDQNYYFNRRGAYFYLEDDPIPKDLHEWFSEMDSKQLENVIIRAQTKDPKNLVNFEKTVVWLKRFIIFCLIASAIASFFAFKNNSMIQELGQKIGITFSI